MWEKWLPSQPLRGAEPGCQAELLHSKRHGRAIRDVDEWGLPHLLVARRMDEGRFTTIAGVLRTMTARKGAFADQETSR